MRGASGSKVTTTLACSVCWTALASGVVAALLPSGRPWAAMRSCLFRLRDDAFRLPRLLRFLLIVRQAPRRFERPASERR